ncbi:GNAT family N-acetyltransferase [Georgenia thermotolerans]|uniref:GNAT family N-acetyltransferase n=1 Tax=Georgenia thermotolerans TaxID=527326 RepID=A0A7J5UUU8_9MICO|nr:GNAT family N-acetyltransferase [Georgenia thermotolerans]KAE8766043.1 GNAT family N-acetyltransferase [Georgenia thermotolerans]
MAAIAVTHLPERRRYEARVDGRLAGFTQYRVAGDQDVFVHTVVIPAFEGRGVGSTIVRGALDDVRARGRRAVAVCPFMAAWLERHPGVYDDILDEAPPRAGE